MRRPEGRGRAVVSQSLAAVLAGAVALAGVVGASGCRATPAPLADAGNAGDAGAGAVVLQGSWPVTSLYDFCVAGSVPGAGWYVGPVPDAGWYEADMVDCRGWDVYRDDGGYVQGVDCALAAQDAGLPFVLASVWNGVDTIDQILFLRTGPGLSWEIAQHQALGVAIPAVTACSGFGRGGSIEQPLLCLSPQDAGTQCCGRSDAGNCG